MKNSNSILAKIDETLAARKTQINHQAELAEPSYVMKLYQKGDEAICKKIAEEAAEVVMASKDLSVLSNHESQNHLVYEVADLWFHTMVLLQQHGLNSEMVLNELARREGLSGIIEKENR